jgi:putative sigma-54 modulation protein
VVNITTRGFKNREEITQKVENELLRVKKMLPANADYDITISFRHDEFICDVTVKNIGTFIRGEARAEEVPAAIDFAIDDLKRKLRKYKTKIQRKYDFKNYDETFEDIEDIEESDVEFYIKKTKIISPLTMNDDEAILQMEMLGHPFFIYLDTDGKTSVVYKRKENSYGKIICK